MFPGAYFAESYFTGYYFPPVLGVVAIDIWIIFLTADEG